MKKRTLLIGYAIILLWMFLPLLLVLTASTIASSHGCQLDEGGAHPCVVGGTDLGETLNTLFVMGWFSLLTLPTGGLAFVAFSVAALILHFKRRKQPA